MIPNIFFSSKISDLPKTWLLNREGTFFSDVSCRFEFDFDVGNFVDDVGRGSKADRTNEDLFFGKLRSPNIEERGQTQRLEFGRRRESIERRQRRETGRDAAVGRKVVPSFDWEADPDRRQHRSHASNAAVADQGRSGRRTRVKDFVAGSFCRRLEGTESD